MPTCAYGQWSLHPKGSQRLPELRNSVIVILLFLAVLFVAYANGANDNFKGVASIYGSGTARAPCPTRVRD